MSFENAVLSTIEYNGYKSYHELSTDDEMSLTAEWLKESQDDISNYLSTDCLINVISALLGSPLRETSGAMARTLLIDDLRKECGSNVERAYSFAVNRIRSQRLSDEGYRFVDDGDDQFWTNDRCRVEAI